MNPESFNNILQELYAATGPEWEFSHWEAVEGPFGCMWAAVDTTGRQRMFCGDKLKDYFDKPKAATP